MAAECLYAGTGARNPTLPRCWRASFHARNWSEPPRPATEYQLRDYRTISGVPVVHQILLLRDGKQFFKQEYTLVELNTALDARLFSSSQWRVPSRTP